MIMQKNSPAPAINERRITSVEIANLTGKNHKDLLRSIRQMEAAWTKFTGRKFALSKYIDSSGKSNVMYLLTKVESLYIIAKFSDEVRARLVKRWYELEHQVRGRRIKTLPHEQKYFAVLNESLVKGDIKRTAAKLNVTAKHVSRVKCGVYRSWRVMQELLAVCRINKTYGIADGYPQIQLELW